MALVFSVIRIFRITEIAGATRKDENILLAKRKRYNSTLNLTLMTVIIYTGNKVKSNRGEEKKKGFFARLKEGLTKTRNSIVSGIDSVFRGFTDIDDDFYEELEETLIM